MLHYFQYHITHCCNLRCIHCYQEEYLSHTPYDEMLRVLNQYCDYIKHNNYEGHINLTGGEPLLHPQFFDFAKEIRRRDIALGVLTNGTLIDDANAEALASLKPVFVQISLDGTEKIHDMIRGAGSFKKALQGIDLLKKHNVRVLVSFTIQKLNYKSIAGLANVCNKHGVDKLWFDRVITDSPEAAKELALTTNEFQAFLKTARFLRLLYMRNGKSFVSLSRSLQSVKQPYICSAGRNLIVILADGTVMPCRRLPFKIGNVNDTPLEEIIQTSPVMKELAENVVPRGCYGCKRFTICQGGAKCVTYAQTGELHLKDVNCTENTYLNYSGR